MLELETISGEHVEAGPPPRPAGDGMRVLHCIHSLYGGGAERQLKLIAGGSHRVGIRSAILCVKPDANEKLDLPIYQARLKSKFDLSIYRAAQDAIRDFQPDVLHAWLPASMTIPAMIAAKRHGIPCVYSYRNAMRFHRPLSIAEYAVAAICSQRIVSNNPVGQSIAAYRALYHAKAGLTIPNAVQIAPHFRKEKPFRVTEATARLLFVGRLTRQKNIDCLLRALAQLPPDLSWEQVICGTGEEEASLRQLTSELGLGNRVTFSGYRHDVYELMQKSDLLILPSWWEGMPNVLLESLAIGLPCIASDISANRALLDDSCCAFFSPESPVELARVITALLRDPGRLERQTEAGLRVARDHSVDALLEKYAAFYRSISPATDDSYVAASRRPQT